MPSKTGEPSSACCADGVPSSAEMAMSSPAGRSLAEAGGPATKSTLSARTIARTWTDTDFVQRYYDELAVEKELLWVDLAKSRAAAYDYLGTSPEKLSEFFDRYL